MSKAAALLQIAQPSLSRQIMQLEQELGHQLFRRTARGVELTAAGVGLARHVDNVFAQVERIPEVVRIAAEQRELVRIGLPQGLPHGWLFDLLDVIAERIPQLSLSMVEATTDEQRELLQKGHIDLALVHTDPREAHSVLVLEQPSGIAVPPESELASIEALGFEHLGGLTIMAHAAGEIAAEEARLRSAAMRLGIAVHWVFRRFSEHSWPIAKTAGVDAVLLTRVSAERHLPDWRWIPLNADDHDGRAMAIRTWAAWNDSLAPVAAELIELLRQSGASLG